MAAQDGWYYAHGQETIGPFSLADLVGKLPAETGMNTLVFGPGIAEWTEARHVAAIVEFSRGRGARDAAATGWPPARHPSRGWAPGWRKRPVQPREAIRSRLTATPASREYHRKIGLIREFTIERRLAHDHGIVSLNVAAPELAPALFLVEHLVTNGEFR